MDSLTQIALGSAVGYAVLGSKVGRKAALYGAILGTVPDLDVFINFGGPVENFTFHRSFSHSLLVQLFVSPLIAWLLCKLHPQTQNHKVGWFLLVFLTLSTHAILDSFTVYGTQLLWPLMDYPFGISSLFIIDPLYTLPLVVGLLAFLVPKLQPNVLKSINHSALILSSIYAAWSLGAKWYIDNKVEQALANSNITVGVMESTPAPLSTLLWRVVVVNDTEYFEIFTSVFDDVDEVSIDSYPTNPSLLVPLENEWGIKRLKWFTKGLYSVREQDGRITLTDLRMGLEDAYVFAFEVGKRNADEWVAADYTQLTNRPNLSEASLLWDRIWDPAISLTPQARQAAIRHEQTPLGQTSETSAQ
uniref:metal-dependent hydrolase n=1 Tax=Ningiella ruwaisensis TaxID=2364274 RepID=UPI0010A0AE06|nr:metal-dependent hydrolase [Ningiella ruwaisensis]